MLSLLTKLIIGHYPADCPYSCRSPDDSLQSNLTNFDELDRLFASIDNEVVENILMSVNKDSVIA